MTEFEKIRFCGQLFDFAGELISKREIIDARSGKIAIAITAIGKPYRSAIRPAMIGARNETPMFAPKITATILPARCCGAVAMAAEMMTGRSAQRSAPKAPSPTTSNKPEPRYGITPMVAALKIEQATIKSL